MVLHKLTIASSYNKKEERIVSRVGVKIHPALKHEYCISSVNKKMQLARSHLQNLNYK